MRSSFYILLSLVLVLASCDRKDELVVRPPAVLTNLRFTIRENLWQAKPVTYSLRNCNYLIDNIDYTGGLRFKFMVAGRDSATNAEVVVSGKAAPAESTLNIAITQDETTVFFKDCNHEQLSVQEGNDSKGRFVKLRPTKNCLTTTLDSDRRMHIDIFNLDMPTFTLYFQGE